MTDEELGDEIKDLQVVTGVDLDTGKELIRVRINSENFITIPPDIARNLGIALIEAANEITKPN